jgi:1,4-alpha-glucan branching enzyme
VTKPIGTFCLVLHTHLPWLAHHGSWPVGEEWLHQAWATSYLPVISLLETLADEGRSDVLTLGVSPVLAAQLDDPYCIKEQRTWHANWQLRAEGMAGAREPWRREAGTREFKGAIAAQQDFDTRWQRGASPILRRLSEGGVIEILGGPATHNFQPLSKAATRRAALLIGQNDSLLRRGNRPTGIWAPECAYTPGLELEYAEAGVNHFMVDGPTMNSAGRSTGAAWQVADSDVVAFARDLEVTYRVWSPRKGYPGGKWYRDFHTFDHEWGVRPVRVTGRSTPSHEKAPYDPERAMVAVERDARDFVSVVRNRLLELGSTMTESPLVVAAYDTELFGHWWHEGPQWLAHVLRLLPESGVTVTTLQGAMDLGQVAGRVDLANGSWGSGKDWRVWEGDLVQDVVQTNSALEVEVLDTLRKYFDDPVHLRERSVAADQLARELLLTLASDWAFMITKDSAAQYARRRSGDHLAATKDLIRLISSGNTAAANTCAIQQQQRDYAFGHLDARTFIQFLD